MANEVLQSTGEQVLIRRVLYLEHTVQKLVFENQKLKDGLRLSLKQRPMPVPGTMRYVPQAGMKMLPLPATAAEEDRVIASHAHEVTIEETTLAQLWAARERLEAIERDRLYALRRKELEYEARLKARIFRWLRRS
jgi:hypothetical protein